ncbi:acetolactate synthase small subunit [Bacteroidia bacterium]|nr:acetolactate synthase small subunit [Bacteroidia bacterium]GHT81038.1 acetolactate synthase small subunit [Bacteroidia bacterium]
MEKEYTITVFTENAVGLLNRITIIFTRRHVNIESLTVSASALKGVHKFTIVVNATQPIAERIVNQIDKLVEVLKAFYHTNEDIVYQELALYKLSTEALLKGNEVEKIVREHAARILEITPTFTTIELTGHREELLQLFDRLDKACGVLQYTSSGRIAIHRNKREALTEHLDDLAELHHTKKIEKVMNN